MDWKPLCKETGIQLDQTKDPSKKFFNNTQLDAFFF